MSLVIALGSNMGDKLNHLNTAIEKLNQHFTMIAKSHVYESAAIEYENQNDFLNQVVEFKVPKMEVDQVMQLLLDIEQNMGRQRDIPKGPRVIDLDILFWGNKSFHSDITIIPHPRWSERSFVVLPLTELPFYESLKKWAKIPTSFSNTAKVYKG
jgi:2-amino-4-hydroxy-6-hydroxymethyldihydropteridine diphosphokinase